MMSSDSRFKSFTEGDKDLGKEIIRSQGSVKVNKPHKIRLHFGPLIGCGYDFEEKEEGTPSKEIYQRAVKNTKEIGGRPGFETFVKEGVVEDRYGWYITRL